MVREQYLTILTRMNGDSAMLVEIFLIRDQKCLAVVWEMKELIWFFRCMVGIALASKVFEHWDFPDVFLVIL